MTKRKISAKELAGDIISGMELPELLKKYQLPQDRLKPVLDKLLSIDAVTPEQIQNLMTGHPKAPERSPTSAPEVPARDRGRDTVLEPVTLPHEVVPPATVALPTSAPSVAREAPPVTRAPFPAVPTAAAPPRRAETIRPEAPPAAVPPELKKKDKRKGKPLWEIMATLLWCAIAVGLLMYFPNLLAPINFKIYDMKVAVTPPPKGHPDIVHLDVDDTAILKYGQWPWDRAMSGRIVQRLHELGATAVVFDVLYCADGKSKEGNEALFEAIKKAGNVVSATGVGITHDHKEKLVVDQDSSRADALYERSWAIRTDPSFTPAKVNSLRNSFVPMIPIIQSSAEMGHVKGVPDSDGVHRRFPMLVKLEDRYVPGLSLAALRTYWKLKPSDTRAIDRNTLEISIRGQQFHVPLDSEGNMIVRWGDAWETFPHYSVVDLLNDAPDPGRKSRYRNKVVVVGFAATGNTDLGTTPLAVNVPMSRIHSFALNTVITNSFIRQVPAFPWVAAASVLITILFSVAAARLRWRVGLIIACVILVSVVAALIACFLFLSWEIPSAEFAAIFLPPALFVLAKRALTIEWRAAKASRAMERYLDPKLINEIMESGEGLDIAAKRKELTVMFVNIEGFSTIAETLDVEQLHKFLNDFYKRMTRVIFEHRGTVDKFLGDGLLVFFGDPMPLDNHADAAVDAAMDMQREMARLNEHWAASGIQELMAGVEIRIGINTGMVVVGDLGSDRRVEYTVVGSAVNMANGLQSLAPAGGVMMSQRTRMLMAGDVECEGPERIRLKGFDRDVDVFRVYPDAID